MKIQFKETFEGKPGITRMIMFGMKLFELLVSQIRNRERVTTTFKSVCV
jgi:hypothetical protein